jgi:multidrug efflux pump subunit AcrB
MIVVTQLPDGASKERTDAVLDKIQKLAQPIPALARRDRQRHFDPRQSRQPLANAGVAFVVMKDWDVRLKEQGQDQESIQRKINGALQSIPEAFSFADAAANRRSRRRQRGRITMQVGSATAISTMTFCKASPTPSSRTAMPNPVSRG